MADLRGPSSASFLVLRVRANTPGLRPTVTAVGVVTQPRVIRPLRMEDHRRLMDSLSNRCTASSHPLDTEDTLNKVVMEDTLLRKDIMVEAVIPSSNRLTALPGGAVVAVAWA